MNEVERLTESGVMRDHETAYQRLFWTVISAIMVGLIAFAGVFVTTMLNVGALTVAVDNLKGTMGEVKAELSAGTQKRYTSDQAALDRAAMMQFIGELQAANREQEQVLRDLLQFKARAEERMSLHKTP